MLVQAEREEEEEEAAVGQQKVESAEVGEGYEQT